MNAEERVKQLEQENAAFRKREMDRMRGEMPEMGNALNELGNLAGNITNEMAKIAKKIKDGEINKATVELKTKVSLSGVSGNLSLMSDGIVIFEPEDRKKGEKVYKSLTK